ncbi:MAG: SUMF1/EgtB/PvdO family nonheme iron enzyme [Pirellulales bacterium]|nr:SUMF1/EgtB/PvdO family nonheme iron enzyme [Pirellulales bacterium]
MSGKQLVWSVLLVGLWAAMAQAVNIDLVWVGNPGNVADDTGYGSVDKTYYIGKYEVTAGQYTEFLNAVAATDVHGLYNTSMMESPFGCKIERRGTPGNYSYHVADDRKDRPVNFVSFWDATRFVNWLHNGQGNGDTESGAYVNVGNQTTFARQPGAKWFIPTEDEWYKAAYHRNDGVTGNYFDYPTGSDTAPLNTVEATDPGNRANYYDELGTGNGSYTIGGPYWMTEVGEFENSASPYGTFDQGGNVWEWTENATGSARGFRGGAWYHESPYLAASYSSWLDPRYDLNNFGFRVASIPEPSTIALLVGGLLSVVCWRRCTQ